MDLSNIDPTNPQNTELARLGAGRIRDLALGTITSFQLEHALAGQHTFPRGDTASRPAAGVPGRIYINTERGSLERDDGANWVICRVAQPGKNTNSVGGAVPGTFLSILAVNVNVSLGAFVLVDTTLQFVLAASSSVTVKLRIGGVDTGLEWTHGTPAGATQDFIMHLCDLITTGVVEGSQLVEVLAKATTGTVSFSKGVIVARGI